MKQLNYALILTAALMTLAPIYSQAAIPATTGAGTNSGTGPTRATGKSTNAIDEHETTNAVNAQNPSLDPSTETYKESQRLRSNGTANSNSDSETSSTVPNY